MQGFQAMRDVTSVNALHDPHRLEALKAYDILDTPAEEEFERMTDLAAQVFDTRFAFLGFIDERRHWFKSCFGTDLAEVSHEASFCVYTLELDDTIVVLDATRDERFAENPLVTGEPHMRFYAGVPLRSSDGLVLGTLCIMDTQTRTSFSDRQRSILERLAGTVETELELRRTARQAVLAEHARRRSEARFRSVIANSSDVTTLLARDGTIRYQSPAIERVLERSPQAVEGTRILDYVHPDDRDAFRSELEAVAAGADSVSCLHRLSTAEGGWRWLESVLTSALSDPDVNAIIINSRDVTQRETFSRDLQKTSTRLRNTLESIGDAFVLLDTDARVVDVNAHFLRLLRQPQDLVVGEIVWDVLPHLKESDLRRAFGHAVETQQPSTFEWHSERLDTWFEVHAYPGPDGIAVYFRDVRERKAAHEMLVQAKEAAERANIKLGDTVTELERRTAEMDLLSELGEVLQACHTSREAFAVSEDYLGDLFPDRAGQLYIASDVGGLLEPVVTWGELGRANDPRVLAADQCWALRRGRSHVVDTRRSHARCAHVEDAYRDPYICVPLMAQGDTLGVLHVRTPQQSEVDPAAKRLSIAVSEQIALAYSNLQLRERLRSQAIRDPLTGLFNRRYLDETLAREVHRAARNQQPISVLMLDADHFKSFNDTYGHEVGDLVLQEIAQLMTRNCRLEDIPCRYGGEEFLIVLPGLDVDTARDRAELLRTQAKDIRLERGREPVAPISLSLGVATYPQHGAGAAELIREADAALYRAKAQGRDQVAVAKEETA